MRKPRDFEIPVAQAEKLVAPEQLEDVLRTLCGFDIIEGYRLGQSVLTIRLPRRRRPDAFLFALEADQIPQNPIRKARTHE